MENKSIRMKPGDEILDRAEYFCLTFARSDGREAKLNDVMIFLQGIFRDFYFDICDRELIGKVLDVTEDYGQD